VLGNDVQIGSLRQLTLAGFLLALVPLVVLLWQSQSTLSKMSDIAASEAQFSVGMARQIGKIESVAIDVERLIRQYHVLKKDELKDLTENYISRILELLEKTCSELKQNDVCLDLEQRLTWFQNNQQIDDQLLLDAQLAEFRRSLVELRLQVDGLLDGRIVQQQAYVNNVQQSQAWSTAVLVTISLLLIIFASQLILLPVAKIERVISAIAQQSETLPSISTSGPKELIELEHKLHWLADRLSQLENLRSALLRHASHELKTPLASIKEGCSLLSDGVVGSLNSQQEEVLSLLNSSTERLNLLIVQLLDYNLLLQQAKPVYQIVDAKQLINEALTDNALAVQQNNHQIVLSIRVEKLYVDENLFRRIVDNLLSNALAHGTVGRPIDIRLYRQTSKLVLEVANRGQKIPIEQRKVLFEPFKRGENKRNDRVIGSGLGLSIVADCARMMQGTADIVDVDYADVCVRVCLSQTEEHL
jgi:two-component system sensor histidine kinase GlrK